jgi:hypothetical protein
MVAQGGTVAQKWQHELKLFPSFCNASLTVQAIHCICAARLEFSQELLPVGRVFQMFLGYWMQCLKLEHQFSTR